MEKISEKYQTYLRILKEELIPALGCTEPIAIAYAAATARDLLGEFPDEITAACSGNIIKNVKSVIVPTTGDLRGIEASAILGAVGGSAQKKLEVLEDVCPEHIMRTRELLAAGMCKVELIRGAANLHIILTMKKGAHSALVEIKESHTNIVRTEKDGEVQLAPQTRAGESKPEATDRSQLNVGDIYDFAETLEIDELKTLLDRQIDYNLRIAEEGLTHSYGANVGSTLLGTFGDDIKTVARAYPAAGSDARMSGCTLPVVINSGSGNQGMTVSLPVIKYAQHLGASDELLYRALALSNLVAIHQKTGIGRLSAYCGAVSAACGSGAGVTYLYGGTLEQVSQTITNTLANVSGIVCDGAKPSCAAKIASSVDAALMGHYMTMNRQGFHSGDGIVKNTVEGTIQSVGRLGKDGMKETDVEILNIMIHP